MSEIKLVTRRFFFQFSLAGILGVPLLLKPTHLSATSSCPATGPKGKLIAKPNEGMAKTLQYVDVANSSKHPKYKIGNDCGNCKFFNKAKEDYAYAPCTMMGMKYVAKCGWCISYKQA